MPFQKGNTFGGNNGGGRFGYTYEKDQLVKLRRIVDRAIAKIEAFDKGQITEKEMDRFRLTMPIILKAMDKLHANKQEVDHKNLPQQMPVPILAPIFAQNVHIHNGNKENKLPSQAHQSSTGGDIGQQDSLNHPVVDSPSAV